MGVDDKEEGEAEKKLIERATMGATQQWNLWNGLLKAYLIRGSKDAKEDSWGPNSVDNDDGFEDEMAMTPEGQRRLRIGQCCCGCSLIELNYRHRWMESFGGVWMWLMADSIRIGKDTRTAEGYTDSIRIRKGYKDSKRIRKDIRTDRKGKIEEQDRVAENSGVRIKRTIRGKHRCEEVTNKGQEFSFHKK
ncbi:hypothetical protein PPACK8108_LOCUS26505 [Phakopsora pachyrhizi]|uniref:Uncharacterized protein n=1 Tax=Phakopsora pachyrhizi TaxID=170000 RepID=A0AAV0BU64_PHAPC|nr:hypothetical protein PPACK8108_LOCUS26505 [Phakopsora pachyrhizi]